MRTKEKYLYFESSPASCGVMMSVTPPIEQLTCTPTTSLELTCRVEMKLLTLIFTNTTVYPSWVWLSPTLSKPALNVTPGGGANTPGLLVVHLTAVPVLAQEQNSVVLGHSSIAFGLQVSSVAAMIEYRYIDTEIKIISLTLSSVLYPPQFVNLRRQSKVMKWNMQNDGTWPYMSDIWHSGHRDSLSPQKQYSTATLQNRQ